MEAMFPTGRASVNSDTLALEGVWIGIRLGAVHFMSVNMSVYMSVCLRSMSAHVGVWHATLSQASGPAALDLTPP